MIRRRFSFIRVTMATTAIIAVSLYFNGQFAERRVEARLTRAITDNVVALWQKTLSFEIQRMKSAQTSLMRDKIFLNALDKEDYATVREQGITTYNLLNAQSIITEFCVANLHGKIIFSAVKKNNFGDIVLRSTKKALYERVVVTGIDWGRDGNPIVVLSMPLFFDKELIGVATLIQDLRQVITNLATDNELAFVVKKHGGIPYSTNQVTAEGIIKAVFASTGILYGHNVVQVKDRVFGVVFLPIEDISGEKDLILGIAKDNTESSYKDAVAKFRLNLVTILLFIMSLVWLYRTNISESSHVTRQQQERISALTTLNQEKDAIHNELQETHERLRQEMGERANAEEQHRHISQLNKFILDAAGEGIFGLDKAGRITFVNPRAASLLGRSMSDLIGNHIHEAMHVSPCMPIADHTQEECPIYVSLLLGEAREATDVFCNGGTKTYPVDYICTPMKKNGEIVGAVVTFNDITDRKRIEEHLRAEQFEQKQLIVKLQDTQNQLLQSEKMASIGQLAAGVAHEINNPVGYVNSNLVSLHEYINDLCRVINFYEEHEMQLPGQTRDQALVLKNEVGLSYLKGDIGKLMLECQEGIGRVKQIVQDLKDFSHMEKADWQWADLRQGLNSTLNIARNEIKYKAEVVKEYEDIPLVECLPGQMNQVFMNLFVNAAQAINEKGVITIRSGRKGSSHVWVSVHDTGQGIKPEHLSKVFDPFFTTKPVGKGTGLGLSLSYSIVKKHQGQLTVESEVGKGTCFTVLLPIEQDHTLYDAAV